MYLEPRCSSLVTLAALTCALAVHADAHAQEAAGSSGEGSGAPLVAEPTAEVSTTSSADQRWSAAAVLLRDGQLEAARAAFDAFAAEFSAEPRAPLARRVAAAIRAELDVATNEAVVTSQIGRVEVVIGSTIWGLGSGAIIGGVLGNHEVFGDEPGKGILWSSVALGATGLGVSLLVTSDAPPTEGQAAAFSSAGVWGYALGFELLGGTSIAEQCYRDEYGQYCELGDNALLLPLAISSAGLVGAGLYARQHPEITTGDVALVNAGGAWGTVTAVAVNLIGEVEGDHAPFAVMLGGTAAGLGTALGLTEQLNVSRGRIGLINLSGALGVGLLAAIGATAEVDSGSAWGSLLLAGEVAGLTTGALLTRRRPQRRAVLEDLELTIAPTLLPVERGESARGFVVSGRW